MLVLLLATVIDLTESDKLKPSPGVTNNAKNGVKKYKPVAIPHLLESKVFKARDDAESAISSAKKTVQSAEVVIKRTRELIEQSRRAMDAARRNRG